VPSRRGHLEYPQDSRLIRAVKLNGKSIEQGEVRVLRNIVRVVLQAGGEAGVDWSLTISRLTLVNRTLSGTRESRTKVKCGGSAPLESMLISGQMPSAAFAI